MNDHGGHFKFAKPNKSSIYQPSADPRKTIEITLSGREDELRDFLILHPDMVNIQEEDFGSVALHVAASKNFVGILELMIRSGANIDIQDYHGNTPLLYAIDKERYEAAQCLIKHGCKINLPDFKGNSPLHTACRVGSPDIVKLLLKNGADPEQYDYQNMRPVQRTRKYEIVEIIDLEVKRRQNKESSSQQVINWLGMGVGLGIGMGMAMVQQQQMYLEQVRTQQNKRYFPPTPSNTMELASPGRKKAEAEVRSKSLNSVQNYLKKTDYGFS